MVLIIDYKLHGIWEFYYFIDHDGYRVPAISLESSSDRINIRDL